MSRISFSTLALAAAAATLAVPIATAAPLDRDAAPKAPPRPQLNARIVVQPGLPEDEKPEKAHGYLARKGAGNGQREGKDDPGRPQGETGDGSGGKSGDKAKDDEKDKGKGKGN